MKPTLFLSVIGLSLLLTACQFEVPVSHAHEIPIDSDLLGVWQILPEDSSRDDLEQMTVLRFSQTEYLVHYDSLGRDSMYFRAYPVLIGTLSALQLEVLGDNEGPLEKTQMDSHMIASYQIIDDKLLVKTLNTDLIDTDHKNSASLENEILKNLNKDQLFANPGRFVKIHR